MLSGLKRVKKFHWSPNFAQWRLCPGPERFLRFYGQIWKWDFYQVGIGNQESPEMWGMASIWKQTNDFNFRHSRLCRYGLEIISTQGIPEKWLENASCWRPRIKTTNPKTQDTPRKNNPSGEQQSGFPFSMGQGPWCGWKAEDGAHQPGSSGEPTTATHLLGKQEAGAKAHSREGERLLRHRRKELRVCHRPQHPKQGNRSLQWWRQRGWGPRADEAMTVSGRESRVGWQDWHTGPVEKGGRIDTSVVKLHWSKFRLWQNYYSRQPGNEAGTV